MDGSGAPRGGPGNVVADLDGVVYLGEQAVPGVAAALNRLRAAGLQLVFATNNSTRAPHQVADRIGRITGLEVDPADIVTSGLAAAAMLSAEDSPVLVLGEDGLREVLRRGGATVTSDPASARCVVVGLDRGFDYRKLEAGLTALASGARFLATNTDVTFPSPSGILPGAGSIVAALAAASGRSPEVAGKPHAAMLAAIVDRLQAGPTWVVGDRPETDLALGTAAGWRRVLVLSGITASPEAVPPEHGPDAVIATAADLAELILG